MDKILSLQNEIKNFCEARDWDQFHTPKDLAIGLITEASELLELFRFKSEAEVQVMLKDEKFRQKVSEEVADVFFFILRFSQMNQFDLEQSLKNKMLKNAERYSVEKSKGSNKKYNE